MIYNLPDIRKIEVKDKKVFIRCDLDVVLSGAEVADQNDLRLISGLQTIQYLLDHGARIIIGGHLGRPKNKYQISNINSAMQNQISNEEKEFSLEPVAGWLKSKINSAIQNQRSKPISKLKTELNGFAGWEITPRLFLLENLRFYEEEEKNDSEFAKELASLADIYVNEAFAVLHRAHASVVGVPQFLPHFAGLHLQKEIKELSSVLNNPKRPLVVLIGGIKIETKLPLVSKMLEIADYVLAGGKIVQELEIKNKKLLKANSNQDETDITNGSVAKFLEVIKLAKMIVWNGPVGKMGDAEVAHENFQSVGDSASLASELVPPSADSDIHSSRSPKSPPSLSSVTPDDTEKGTRMLAQGIINSSAYKIAGGGDTIDFLQKSGLINKFDFVSTGGGAMLAFLSGEKLPGIEALLIPNY